MPDIDPATAYRTLTERAAALRAEAEAARKQSVAADQADDRRFGQQRDELDRDRGALARDAELADEQVKQLDEQRQMMVESAERFEADIASGKPVGQDTLWKRNAEEARAAAEQLAERAAAARADAAATREQVAGVDRKLVDLDNEVRVAGEEAQEARMAIFALDDQTGYLEEAARRYGEAAAAGDNIPERAAKELAAEQALRNADATTVDRDAIRRVIPTFPEQTPGIEEHPWPPVTPDIGPEETLDPYADDADAAAADVGASTETDPMALSDPFDGSSDDDGAVGADSAGGDDDVLASTDTGDGFTAASSGGYDDAFASTESADGFTAETSNGYDDATAFVDPAAAYSADYADDSSAAFGTDTAGGDEYADVADSGFDEGFLA